MLQCRRVLPAATSLGRARGGDGEGSSDGLGMGAARAHPTCSHSHGSEFWGNLFTIFFFNNVVLKDHLDKPLEVEKG